MTVLSNRPMSPTLRFFGLLPFLLMIPLVLGIAGVSMPSTCATSCFGSSPVFAKCHATCRKRKHMR
jgi:hypothetical protein